MLYSLILQKTGRPVHKAMHYVAVYERHFGRFVGRPLTFLEIGAGSGGSVELWKQWFGPQARIVAIDINPACKAFEDEQIKVRIGDQSDTRFLQSVIDEFGAFDAILDDGSHRMDHIKATFEYLYPRMAANGVYMVEDVGTAYDKTYGGGYKRAGTIIEYFKDAVDQINEHCKACPRDGLLTSTAMIAAWSNVVVFEKAAYINRTETIIGDWDMWVTPD